MQQNKKNYIAAGVLLASVFSFQTAYSEPIQFDTDDAHVIVIRPVDLWSPSERSTEDLLDRYKLKQVRYVLCDATGKKVFGEKVIGDNPLAREVDDLVKPLGFVSGGWRGVIFTVEKPVLMDVKDMPAFLQSQDAVYKATVAKAGNPSLLTAKKNSQQWLGTAFGLVVAGLGVKTFGSVAAPAMQGPMQDVYSATLRQVVVPQPSVPFDYSGFKSVEIRRVTQGGDRAGQIIIAYRGDKTSEAEQHALAKAIVSATGADTSVEAIVASQAKDLATRQATWDACVEAKECKDE